MAEFPITERQFNDWLARVAATEPGRKFVARCHESCVVAAAAQDMTGDGTLSITRTKWQSRRMKGGFAPEWCREFVSWFDATFSPDTTRRIERDFKLEKVPVRAADLWTAYCAKFGIAPPPVEKSGRVTRDLAHARAALAGGAETPLDLALDRMIDEAGVGR